MELFHNIPHIDFMGKRRTTAMLSVVAFIISIFCVWHYGLNFGLDFTGGTQIEFKLSKPMETEEIQEYLEANNYKESKVTLFGTARDILVRLPNQPDISEQELGRNVLAVLSKIDSELELRRVEFVGSEVGEKLAEQGGLAVLVALLATMLYIAMRFEYRFAVSAAVALLHDPIIILGLFAYFQVEFDLAALAAILAVIGYSLNDTIVVYDRVRENFRKMRKGTSYEIMNHSINQTLSRTIMTSVLTLLVVLALYFFGGESLHGFSAALLIGIVVGTYSSIFVAGALALTMGLSRTDLLAPVKNEADDIP